ncbi:hypothetical protein BN938_2183 [Mucinivorans hirudinis]|uniref:Uncharacterized protein n=1 Tax=Mucinivorans hirudinis TaxID=1433126 RepID=A0A060R9F9_9BACT|nr:hypothetical protein BN938_2183 [Mucinivorans hirudinis]
MIVAPMINNIFFIFLFLVVNTVLDIHHKTKKTTTPPAGFH